MMVSEEGISNGSRRRSEENSGDETLMIVREEGEISMVVREKEDEENVTPKFIYRL